MTQPFKITKQTTIVEKTVVHLELDLDLARDLCSLLDIVDVDQGGRLGQLWSKLDDAVDAPAASEVFEVIPLVQQKYTGEGLTSSLRVKP